MPEPSHWLQMVTWGDEALVLAATVDHHVGSRSSPYWSLLQLVTWSSERLSDKSWWHHQLAYGMLALRHTCWRVHVWSFSLLYRPPFTASSQGRTLVLQPASLWSYIRGFTECWSTLTAEFKYLSYQFGYLLYYGTSPHGRSRWHQVMSLVSQSERFNSVERTFTSFLVGVEVGWQRLEWLALKHTV